MGKRGRGREQEEAGIIDELIQRETWRGGGGQQAQRGFGEIRPEKCRRNARTSPHLHDSRRESNIIGLSPTKTGI